MKKKEKSTSSKKDAPATITLRTDDLWKIGFFVVLALLVFSYVNSGTSDMAVAGDTNAPNNGAAKAPSNVQASVDDDPVLGNKNAKVTIIEFSDFQCPFCRKFWTETFSQIKSTYIDTGKVRFVYRDFPLTSIHPGAEPAARAANCVREQGGDSAYYEFHDKIFKEGNILDGGDPLTGPVRGTAQFGETELKQWAKDIGYDINSCLDSGKYADEVAKDLADGQAAGGRGTPYFVINGKPVSGALPFSAFKQIIDAELAK